MSSIIAGAMILRVHRKPFLATVVGLGLAAVLTAPQTTGAQNLGTIGTGVAGESTATRPESPPVRHLACPTAISISAVSGTTPTFRI
jgi:hypothetical protein